MFSRPLTHIILILLICNSGFNATPVILKEPENKENEVGFRFEKREHFLHPYPTPIFAKNRKLIPHEYNLIAKANEKFYIYLKDKKNVTFNPYNYFHPKAISRRLKEGLSLYDSTDFPINSTYKEIIEPLADSVTCESRWLNMLTVYTSQENIETIGKLPFVSFIGHAVPAFNAPFLIESTDSLKFDKANTLSDKEKLLLSAQTSRLGGKQLYDAGIDGKGITIAVFDAGFPGVNKSEVFKHLIQNNQILKTYDFVKKKENVYDFGVHGTMVLSCIAGIYNGIRIGLAPGASFLLARTEYPHYEPSSEEENWLAAAEWADREGADIINSSLGYTFHRYFYENMNGQTSLVAKAANMAARKGILVVNAAGNDGDTKWHFIGTPADADSVLAVGGTNPYTDYKIAFSSYGPTKDSRLKPNVCAFGLAIAQAKKKLTTVPGTSFASPLVAGFSACAKQLYPELKNMELFHEIEKSGHLYPYFDYGHGYGIPQAEYFLNHRIIKNPEPTFKYVRNDSNKTVIFLRKDILAQKLHVLNLYYHIEENNGFLRNFGVSVINYHFKEKDTLQFQASDSSLFGLKEIILPDDFFPSEGEKLRIHFEGYTEVIMDIKNN